MSDAAVISFVASRLSESDVAGKDVVELGSLIVDETSREFVLSRSPRRFVGVDMRPGPGVDLVCDVRDAPKQLTGAWDVVISTSMLEHASDWRGAVVAIKSLCHPGTTLIITVPTIGFRYHGHPADHWRFTIADFAKIFADTEILELTEDVDGSQIMMKATATEKTGSDTPALPIYNIVYETPRMPLSEDELQSRSYAIQARLRVFKVGAQDVMGALALFLGVSLPHRDCEEKLLNAIKSRRAFGAAVHAVGAEVE